MITTACCGAKAGRDGSAESFCRECDKQTCEACAAVYRFCCDECSAFAVCRECAGSKEVSA